MRAPSSLAIIFDFDGVLVDSFTHNARHLIAALEPHGVKTSEADLWHHRGDSLPMIVSAFGARTGRVLPYDEIEQTVNRRQAASRQQLAVRGLPAGLVALLDATRAASIPLAIGSSNTLAHCREILTILEIVDYFQTFVTCDDVDRHKPDPTTFRMAAERLGVDPGRCVVVEDAETGIEAAHRAGMRAVGFTGFLRSSNEPLLPHADLRIASFTELSIDRLQTLVDHHRT